MAIQTGMGYGEVAAAVWLWGALAWLGFHLVRHARFMAMVRRWSELAQDEGVLDLFESLRREMEIGGVVTLRICPLVGSPMLVGILHPRVLLPRGDWEPEALECVLRHELIHFQRRDSQYKWALLVATAIHWWNPVVHLMGRSIGTLCEISCDEAVVEDGDEALRRCYCAAMIDVARHHTKWRTALVTDFDGGMRIMKHRIA